MSSAELTLIVAATRSMGIGANGGMPWRGLRKEMQYFARVTTRVLPQQNTSETLNAVIMGRKTWDSIPPKFRPLKDRLNIIISRSHPPSPPSTKPSAEGGVWMSSLESALQYVSAHQGSSSSLPTSISPTMSSPASSPIGRVFVIGGAQIYKAALELPQARRVLLTRIEKDFECDTFFPLDLKPDGKAVQEGWRRKEVEEWRAWTGEEDLEPRQEEAGTPYEWEMWEKEG